MGDFLEGLRPPAGGLAPLGAGLLGGRWGTGLVGVTDFLGSGFAPGLDLLIALTVFLAAVPVALIALFASFLTALTSFLVAPALVAALTV